MSYQQQQQQKGFICPKIMSDFLWGALSNNWTKSKLHKNVFQTVTNGDFCKATRLIEEVFKFLWVVSIKADEVGWVRPSEIVAKGLICLLQDPQLYYSVCDRILSLHRPLRV